MVDLNAVVTMAPRGTLAHRFELPLECLTYLSILSIRNEKFIANRHRRAFRRSGSIEVLVDQRSYVTADTPWNEDQFGIQTRAECVQRRSLWVPPTRLDPRDLAL